MADWLDGRKRLAAAAAMLAAILCLCGSSQAMEGKYCVVVSAQTRDDPGWKTVVDTLRGRHKATVLVYKKSVEECLAGLRRESPRYIGFVAKPTEAGREFVADIHHVTRRLNDDPYTDALWGIITGYDAPGALRLVQNERPLVIHRSLAATEIDLRACDEGQWFCELHQGKMLRKAHDGKPEQQKAPSDTTQKLVEVLSTDRPELFVTSGHATERDWQIGYGYRNGQFRCERGQLYGLDTKRQRFAVHSDNPKVYLPVGNCLMGHVDGPDCMAIAFMNSAGVRQMVGYTVPTWYGYGGWGMLDYFVEQPGRYTLAEAFLANQQALVHRLSTYFPELTDEVTRRRQPRLDAPLSEDARKAGLSRQDAAGLLNDCDTVAFDGDPAWEARMAPGQPNWNQKLSVDGNRYRLEIKPIRGNESFSPVNTNGSQRGGRPFVEFLPGGIDAGTVRLQKGSELKPLVTGTFILVPNPGTCDPERTYAVEFTAEPARK